jgi:hypothetical protein
MCEVHQVQSGENAQVGNEVLKASSPGELRREVTNPRKNLRLIALM